MWTQITNIKLRQIFATTFAKTVLSLMFVSLSVTKTFSFKKREEIMDLKTFTGNVVVTIKEEHFKIFYSIVSILLFSPGVI